MRFKLPFVFLFFALILPESVPAYFQQHIDYRIRAELFPGLNRVEGRQQMVYRNNSPDTLAFLYIHLYMNRYRPSQPETEPRQNGYIEIISFKDEAGNDLASETDNTILKVYLKTAILPGDSQKFRIRFTTKLPLAGERFGYYGDHFDVGNWYPAPAVYDARGWHADQHREGEFYQEWADFTVDLTLPVGFVVAASGELLNPEVMPDSVRFEERRMDYYNRPDSGKVTYRFRARQVHDFVWSADPEFVLREAVMEGTTLQFFILPYRLEDWEPQVEIAEQAIRLFEEKIGPYPYPVLSVVDGYVKAGGIEYPNLVIINDMIYDTRELSATIIHEIAHQWFYGLIGNNQTDYGWMDEGFATFFENLGMQQVLGDERNYIHSPTGFFGKYFGYWENPAELDRLVYLSYIRSGQEEPINLPFDRFQHDPFTPYYQKMSLVIEQLQLTLGDSIFWRGIQEYYRHWRFRHPYPEDLFAGFEAVSGRNLRWFFTEWLNTTWHCDYAVRGFSGRWKKDDAGRYFEAQLGFRRNGAILMPLDFRVTLQNGSVRNYRIPVAALGNFHPPGGSEISPWEFYRDEKTVQLRLPEKIRQVEMNPQNRLLDVNPFNNRSGFFPPVRWYWLHRQYLLPHTDAYTATVFPFAFYNDRDGVQLGVRTRGNFVYPDLQHRLRLLIGVRHPLPDAEFWFEHPLYALNKNVHFITHLYNSAGRGGAGLWLQFSRDGAATQLTTTLGWQGRRLYDREYAAFPAEESTTSSLEGIVRLEKWGTGFLPSGWEIRLAADAAFPGGDFNYQQWQVLGRFRVPFLFLQKLEGRLFSGGSYGNLPLRKAFRGGGASGYELFSNPYLRAKGTLPAAWWREGHLFQPGGGNLRALAGQWQPLPNYPVSAGLSVTLGNPLNLTLHYVPYLSDLMFSAFTTWTTTSGEIDAPDNYLGEAGFSVSATRLPFIFYYFDIEQIHFDFPVWVNRNIEDSGLKMRWNIRIDIRSFY